MYTGICDEIFGLIIPTYFDLSHINNISTFCGLKMFYSNKAVRQQVFFVNMKYIKEEAFTSPFYSNIPTFIMKKGLNS